MRHKSLLALLLIFSIKSFSQDSGFGIVANHPIPIGDNFFGNNYKGNIDIGVKYDFSELKTATIGASINGGFLRNAKTDILFDVKVYPIQPRIFAEFNIESMSNFHPQIGIGYSFLIFKANAIAIDPEIPEFKINRTEKGINLNLGVSYDLAERLFILVQYDFIKIGTNNSVPDTKYNNNVSMLKLGLGFRM